MGHSTMAAGGEAALTDLLASYQSGMRVAAGLAGFARAASIGPEALSGS